MAYIYRHIRLDKNIPFYIGIGVDDNEGKFKRSKAKEHRNDYWHRIVSKTDYKVDIILNDLTWEEACEKEREFIKLYGRKDKSQGCLANQTDGGDGGTGVIVKPETREKIRQFQLSLDKKGKPGRVWTQESKDKLANTIRGVKHSPEAIERMRKPRVNKENYSYPKPKIACEICGFLAQPAAISRWHNKNCKKNNS
jgi:hypothetical protein